MNKLTKIIIAFMGATATIFDIFIPLTISLLLLQFVNVNWYTEIILICSGIITSLYKAIDVAGIDTIKYFLKK